MTVMSGLKDVLAKDAASSIKISSSFISSPLVCDSMTKESIERANEIFSKKEEATNLFHSPRIVSRGAHFSYCIPEYREEGTKKTLLLNKKAFENELRNLNYRDKDTIEFLKGTMVNKEQGLSDIWKRLINEYNIFPYSHAYAGFQFGQFAGQLGDGRVVNLLDINNYSIQIKGSGLTPFSRFADGKATLKASIREFIISESLHSIGIPTTRALILSFMPDMKAKRGMKWEQTGIVTRFAETWVRLGSFDLQRWRQDLGAVISLSDYCIENLMPKSKSFIPIESFIDIEEQKDYHDLLICTQYDQFLRNVVISNAISVAKWQAYGFTNGVLNTDNTSIIGLSMDYGPFSFIDAYNEDWTPNKDDPTKRYSLGNQPKVVWWNLVRFAESLTMLIGSGNKYGAMVKKDPSCVDKEIAQYMTDRTIKIMDYVEKEYDFYYKWSYVKLMLQRIGLCPEKLGLNVDPACLSIQDFHAFNEKLDNLRENLINKLLVVLKATRIDYNNFFLEFQKVNTVALMNGDSTFSQDLLRCFEQIHEGPSSIVDSEALNTIDKMFNLEHIDTDNKVYCALKAFFEEYKRLWESIYGVKFVDISNAKKLVSKDVNPLFVPRHHHFNEVVESLAADINDTSKLLKLYSMSANPYNKELWNPELLPEVEKRWTDLEFICKEKNSFLQCGCSS